MAEALLMEAAAYCSGGASCRKRAVFRRTLTERAGPPAKGTQGLR